MAIYAVQNRDKIVMNHLFATESFDPTFHSQRPPASRWNPAAEAQAIQRQGP